jgi:hypothetical protein
MCLYFYVFFKQNEIEIDTKGHLILGIGENLGRIHIILQSQFLVRETCINEILEYKVSLLQLVYTFNIPPAQNSYELFVALLFNTTPFC